MPSHGVCGADNLNVTAAPAGRIGSGSLFFGPDPLAGQVVALIPDDMCRVRRQTVGMGTAQHVATGRLAGRVVEQRLLAEILSASAEGIPAAVLVHGEAGVGKTRLVRQVTDDVRALGRQVLWGTCVRFGASSVPFAPVIQAFDNWALHVDPTIRSAVLEGSDDLSIMLPAMGVRSADARLNRLLPVVDRVVQRMVERQPTVFVVDDLQWADVSSLDVLAYLVAGFRGQNLALVVTFREEDRPAGHPLNGWLADMRRLSGVSELALARLDEDQTAEQIAQILGRPPAGELVADVMQRSGGNAYLTELLVRDLPGDARDLPSEPPHALREAMLLRWQSLSEPARQLTRLLAVGGRPTTYDTLCPVAEGTVPVVDLPGLLGEAVDAGLLQMLGEQTYWFRHPLLAELLVATFTARELMPVHAAYAAALEAVAATRPDLAPGLSADLAVHHEGAGQCDQAFLFSIRAADFAHDRHATAGEAKHLARACALWERVTEEVCGTTQDRIALLLRTSRVGEQAGVLENTELLDQALSLVDRHRQPLLASTLLAERGVGAWLHDPSNTRIRPELLEAVRLTEPFPDSPERAIALAHLVTAELMELWDARIPARRTQVGGQVREAMEVAQRSGSGAALARALCCRAGYLLEEHREREALMDAEESYLLARQDGEVSTLEWAAIWQANALVLLGRMGEVAKLGQTVVKELFALGSTQWGCGIAATASGALFELGRWDDCQDLLREALSISRIGIAGASVRQVAARLAARRGEVAVAQQHMDRALELVPIDFIGLNGRGIMVELLVVGGESERALDLIRSVMADRPLRDDRDSDGQLLVWGSHAAADVAERARDRRNPDEERLAVHLLDGLFAMAEASPFARAPVTPEDDQIWSAYRAITVAEARRCRGSAGQALAWERAASCCQTIGFRWFEAMSDWRWAQALLSDGATRMRVAEPLRQAHAIALELAAAPLVEETVLLARLARIKLDEPDGSPPRHDDPDLPAALATLTSREREVLSHLVAGRTNSEIARDLSISDKTVSVHVTNVLRKTGTASRVEAASLARRLGMHSR